MGPPDVIEAIDVSANRGPSFRHAGIGPQVHLLVFDCSPQALDKNIVPPGAFAIHADLDPVLHQKTGEGGTGKLGALIGVEDLGPAISGNRFFDSFDAERRIQGDRQPPGQNLAAEPINDGRQIDEAPRHGYWRRRGNGAKPADNYK